MQPVILQKEKMLLAGFGFYGDPFQLNGEWTHENEIGRLWERFSTWFNQNRSSLNIEMPRQMYEVHIEHAETALKGHFEIFVGFEIDAPEDIPPELLIKVLPACTYARFTLTGKEITSDWSSTFYREWLQDSNYEQAFKFGIQVYDERFKGMDNIDESTIDLLIPVQLHQQV